MGTLRDFESYLEGRGGVLERVEATLAALQAKYETFFAEVTRVREGELAQLRDALRAGTPVPPQVRGALDRALADEARAFDGKLRELEEAKRKLDARAQALQAESREGEAAIRKANVTLDREEEELKARSARLIREIETFNTRIRELGRGFGFLSNVFRMRSVQAERRRIEREQSDLTARIESLRLRWSEREKDFGEAEKKRKAEWVGVGTDASALGAKIEHLRASRERVLERSALEQTLFTLTPARPAPGASDPACPRCGQSNSPTSHFCRICAQRLVADRPDLEGSLAEIAEVNDHHRRFAEGVRACQEIIGLVRGLRSGVRAFTKSVSDMISSQRQHSLAELAIDVPKASAAYGQSFDTLLAKIEATSASLHPQEFAKEVQGLISDTYTEARIKAFFETMGQELTRQAKRQW
jgi:DNA repair exonuclease SbcCD ATPase subunit